MAGAAGVIFPPTTVSNSGSPKGVNSNTRVKSLHATHDGGDGTTTPAEVEDAHLVFEGLDSAKLLPPVWQMTIDAWWAIDAC